jgi:hypothetical protein
VRATRLLPAVLTTVLAAVLVGGCAAPAPPAAGTPAAPASAAAPAPAVALPWPARSAAEAAGLQQAADSGAQPWLLDPEETALSYAAAAFGWTTAGAERTEPGTVLVTGPAGARRTLTVVQPVRSGRSGIWSVTADELAPFG